ncbi:MAG: cbb3-type cytochrome c oxidase subunit I [Gammaproteobacteria bacterium]|nr:cbb3-type cytochrome c oxidase subunit I [Gammaproteobacteria bacterium]
MTNAEYTLSIDNAATRRTTTAWVMLALTSLVFAGIYSILLVMARTPAVQEMIPLIDFFHVALVVHVDLSILIWLLSVAAALWSLSSGRDLPTWDKLSFSLAALGTAVVIASPFLGAGDPLMNNYIPILRHPVFYTGLGLFTAGIGSHLLRSSLTRRGFGNSLGGEEALRGALTLSAVVTGIAILAFIASFIGLPASVTGEVYFEFLFWGGGHVLQFAYALLMLVAWIVLAQGSGCRFVLSPRLTLLFLLMAALPVITVPFLYVAHDVLSPGHRLAFTELMKYGGLSCLPAGLAVLASLWNADKPQGEGRHLRSALESSIALFASGGILGFLISGLDIVIPAHYHGSTVGVTIAFMGLIYYLLPRLGFGAVSPRLAFWQPYIYGGGQLLHITGLAWSGGYGVQRKTAGLAQGVDRLGEVAGMGLMGLGGLISVIGGLLFLVVAYKSIRARARRTD